MAELVLAVVALALATAVGALGALVAVLHRHQAETDRQLGLLRRKVARAAFTEADDNGHGTGADSGTNGNGPPRPSRRKRHLDLFVFVLVGAVVLAGQWWHEQWRAHRYATLGGTFGAAALLACAVLYFALWSDTDVQGPPKVAPTATAAPYGPPAPVSTGTHRDSPEPGPSPTASGPAGTAAATPPLAGPSPAQVPPTGTAAVSSAPDPDGSGPDGSGPGPSQTPPQQSSTPPPTASPRPEPSPSGQDARLLCASADLPTLFHLRLCLL